jgi:hypothetical protein
MLRILSGLFLVLHGLVHLLYFGQSLRFFELTPGMVWPYGSWAFSKLLGDHSARVLAGIACALAAFVFVAGGIGLITQQGWWLPLTAGAAVFSSLIFVLFWNGKLHRLDNQGAIAVLINLAILVLLLAS